MPKTKDPNNPLVKQWIEEKQNDPENTPMNFEDYKRERKKDKMP